jgi:hypothetical protein
MSGRRSEASKARTSFTGMFTVSGSSFSGAGPLSCHWG